MKRRFFAIIIAIVAVLLAVGIFTAVAGAQTAEPTVKTHAYNLVFDNQVYIEYAVRISGAENISLSDVGLLIWREGATKHTPESAVADIKAFKTANIDGVLCYVAKYTDLTAKEMADIVTARPYVTLDGVAYYGDDVDYSICEYAERKLGFVYGVAGTENADLSAMLYSMIDYGANAQKYFGYRTDRLATYILPKNRLNVIFDADGAGEIPAQTVAKGNKAISPVAPTKEGFEFLGWFNGDAAWDFGTDTVTENVTLTAKWKKTITYSEGLVYKNNGNNTCSVSGIGTCTDTCLIIPEVSPDGLKVTAIAASAFRGQSFTSVVIPNSVTSIGSEAFENCNYLTSIKLPFVGSEKDEATSNTHFGYIFGASSPSRNGNYVPSSLKDVIITGSSRIGYEAFGNCANIVSITIPESISVIEDMAFMGCSNLSSVYISDIAKWCEIRFGGTVANPLFIAHNLYLNGTLLTDATIPSDVTSIGKYAFNYCTSLKSVTISNGLTTIGEYAFDSCSALNHVTIPDTVTCIGISAFDNCPELIVKENSIYYVDGWAVGCESNTISAEIREGTRNFSDGAFSGKTMLKDISIPKSITEISYRAFYGCTRLTNVIIPDTVTSIGVAAFSGCSGLVSVTLGHNVKTIEDSAFDKCYKLIEVINLSSLDVIAGSESNGKIGSNAKNVINDISNSCIKIDNDGFIFYESNEDVYLIGYSGLETKLITPSSSPNGADNYALYDYLFYNCTWIDGVTISDSVSRISDYAFSYCKNLEYANIGENVTYIGLNAFEKCEKLKSIIIPGKEVTEVGDFAFYYCTALADVTIGKSVKAIGRAAFYQCWNLKNVHFEDTDGWRVSRYSSMSNAQKIDSTALADGGTAAKYLSSTYSYGYYWGHLFSQVITK